MPPRHSPLKDGARTSDAKPERYKSTGQNGQPSELTQAIAAKPNVALVWIGSNDLWNLYEYGPEPMTADAEQADLQAYETNIDKTVHELASHGATVFIALLDDQSKRPVVANPPLPAEPALPATTRADLALMSAHVRAYNDIIGHGARNTAPPPWTSSTPPSSRIRRRSTETAITLTTPATTASPRSGWRR
jgi:hypothetical protein